MTEQKPVILIIEDDLDIAEMLDAYFSIQNYDVRIANWGEDGVEECKIKQPDLVILDIRLPDIDGYRVAEQLRENHRTKNIPIIFLTEKRSRSERLHGLELGADDYITKPFDIQELRLRVRNSLRCSKLGLVINPVTELPEGPIVDERLSDCLEAEWAIMIIGLENLDYFREAYGFVASDDVLRAVSLMVQTVVSKIGNQDEFIGHLSVSDFIVITTPALMHSLEEQIRSRIEQSLDYFYPLKDRESSKLQKNRLAVRIADLTSRQGPFKDVDQIKGVLLQSRK